MKSPLILFILAGLVLTGLSACGGHKEEVVKESARPEARTITLHKSGLGKSIRLPGELKAFEEVDLYAKVNSFVREVLVDRGSAVKEGQDLIRLDAPELDAQYAESLDKLRSREAVLRSSLSYYNRLLQTSKTPGTVSQNDLEQAQSKVQADSADVRSARGAFQAIGEMKNYLLVKAPFSGIISERNVHPGAFVGPSSKGAELPMLRLDEEGKLRLVVAVPEVSTGCLSPDQPVHFQVKAFPSDTFTARIKRISGKLDLKTRSEVIEMDVENKDHRLLPGMYAEVELDVRRTQQAFVVPSSCIFTNTEGVFVIRSNRGKAEWVPVKRGNDKGGQTEIFGDLFENDQLLEQGSDQIRKGQDL